jgi:hypothetical protein
MERVAPFSPVGQDRGVESVCSDGYHPHVSTNGNLVNLEPDGWGRRLFDLVRRGLIWAGYACLGTAFWILGWKGTFTSVLWLTGIGAVLQLAHLLPELSDDSSSGGEDSPSS